MIAIFTSIDEPNVNEVADRLNASRVPFVRINSEEVTERDQVFCRYSDGEFGLCVGEQRVDAKDIGAIWLRKWGAFFTPEDPTDEHTRNLIKHEAQYSYRFAFSLLADKRWMNPPFNRDYVANRLIQAKHAAAAGLKVPAFIVTQCPEQASRFVTANGGRAITKHISQGGVKQGGAKMIFTSLVDAQMFAQADDLRHCPTLLQQYIDKEVELRITIVGDKVFAAAIDSQSSAGEQVDWRKANPDTVSHYCLTLPSEVEHKLLQLMSDLGLVFGAIDMILGQDGEFYFIEVNPEGQWGWLEYYSGLGIYQAIAQWLQNNDNAH